MLLVPITLLVRFTRGTRVGTGVEAPLHGVALAGGVGSITDFPRREEGGGAKGKQ